MTADARRFVVCGEALIDLVPDPQAVSTTFSSGWSALSAGGPMTTSAALAMLGADSHFLGRLSRDAFGRQLRGHLLEAGVELDLVVDSDESTSLAVVSLDDLGKASYAFHFDRTANFDWQPAELPRLTDADWLHLGSLALVVPPGADILLDWVRSVPAPVSIDLNVRPAVIGDPVEYRSRIEPWLRAIGPGGIVKASDEDVAFLEPEGRWRLLAEQWLAEHRLRSVVITRGEGGASAVESEGRWIEVAGYPTEVVDTVGAGDTFMAGFLDGYVRHGHDLRTALLRGSAAASIVCGRQGAQPPTAEEVDRLQCR